MASYQQSRTPQSKLKITGDAPCPACTAKGRDSKGNHLILFQGEDDAVFGKCNKCGHYEPPTGDFKPNERRERTPEELAEQLREVAELPFKELTSRRISASVAERYGVRAGLSEQDGQTVVEHYYLRTRDGEAVAYNVRSLDPKAFYYRGSPRGGTDPFGWSQLGKDTSNFTLYISEDELSAMSVFIIVDYLQAEQYKAIKPASISWSAGAGSAARDLERYRDAISKYKEVVYVHDNDAAGFESAETVRAILPTCKFVCMPLKDVNDMLMAKRSKEAYNLLRFQTKVRSPDCAVRAVDALESALKPPEWGKSYPWQGWTDLTYGQRDGELISVGGGVGCGKTAIAHEVAGWNMSEHKENVAVCLLEETNGNTLKNIAAKIAGVPFHRPDIPFDRDRFMDVYERILKEQLFLWSNKGQNDWDKIKQSIRYWAVGHGCKSLFIDNLTSLVNHLSPTEQNTEIAKIATESAGLADELGIRIFMFSHLNPPKGGKTHEEGAQVKEAQFTGGRGLSRWSQGMWGFERNKQAEGDEKHNSILRYIKDRNFGNTGLIHTRYDGATSKLIQRQGDEAFLAEDDEPMDKVFGND